MNKKAMSGAMLAIIIGAIFIVIVVVGPGADMFRYVKEKFFSGILTPKQQETVVGIPGATQGEGSASTKMLPENRDAALKMLVDEALICWAEFVRSNYADQVCKKFEVHPKMTGMINGEEFEKALENSGDTGKKMVSGQDNYFWDLVTLTGRDKPFWLCAGDNNVNQIGYTRNLKHSECH